MIKKQYLGLVMKSTSGDHHQMRSLSFDFQIDRPAWLGQKTLGTKLIATPDGGGVAVAAEDHQHCFPAMLMRLAPLQKLKAVNARHLQIENNH